MPREKPSPPVKKLTPAQVAGAKKAGATRRKKQELSPSSARLAQIVNLHIAGFTLEQIGKATGSTPEEIDRMLQSDTARYVRSQPALRVYVRNWVSERYTQLLDAVWDEATAKKHPNKLENQDRAMRILDSMRKLHGADAPVQAEVTVDAAPEAVEKLVSALAAGQGLGYDMDIFDGDVIDADVVHDAVGQAQEALEGSSRAVEDADPEAD